MHTLSRCGSMTAGTGGSTYTAQWRLVFSCSAQCMAASTIVCMLSSLFLLSTGDGRLASSSSRSSSSMNAVTLMRQLYPCNPNSMHLYHLRPHLPHLPLPRGQGKVTHRLYTCAFREKIGSSRWWSLQNWLSLSAPWWAHCWKSEPLHPTVHCAHCMPWPRWRQELECLIDWLHESYEAISDLNMYWHIWLLTTSLFPLVDCIACLGGIIDGQCSEEHARAIQPACMYYIIKPCWVCRCPLIQIAIHRLRHVPK